uniref:Uncharacterized protein n=1 Tax=Lepeophtheirus salmonis TaxID=72036 RepID=A0A0K2U0W2_LEPSM
MHWSPFAFLIFGMPVIILYEKEQH